MSLGFVLAILFSGFITGALARFALVPTQAEW